MRGAACRKIDDGRNTVWMECVSGRRFINDYVRDAFILFAEVRRISHHCRDIKSPVCFTTSHAPPRCLSSVHTICQAFFELLKSFHSIRPADIPISILAVQYPKNVPYYDFEPPSPEFSGYVLLTVGRGAGARVH